MILIFTRYITAATFLPVTLLICSTGYAGKEMNSAWLADRAGHGQPKTRLDHRTDTVQRKVISRTGRTATTHAVFDVATIQCKEPNSSTYRLVPSSFILCSCLPLPKQTRNRGILNNNVHEIHTFKPSTINSHLHKLNNNINWFQNWGK